MKILSILLLICAFICLILLAHIVISTYDDTLCNKKRGKTDKNQFDMQFLIDEDKIVIENKSSNLQDFVNSLHTLSSFNRCKIVVTSGIVHMRKDNSYENFKLGTLIADVADYVVIINEENKNFILSGLISHNFNQKKVFFAKNQDNLVEIMTNLTKCSCAILYQN